VGNKGLFREWVILITPRLPIFVYQLFKRPSFVRQTSYEARFGARLFFLDAEVPTEPRDIFFLYDVFAKKYPLCSVGDCPITADGPALR